jgi:SAM-dependent methyltransferase
MTETFDADWLALREPYDAAARSERLAAGFIAALPEAPRLLDLGAGTGSLFRWLAPRIGGSQYWTLVDADRSLLVEALNRIAAWAIEMGFDVDDSDPTCLVILDFDDVWQVDAICLDLAGELGDLPLEGVDGVVCSALLDIVSDPWLGRLAGMLDVPFLACLSVDGRDAWMPPMAGDTIIRAGFRRDQTRAKGFGHALGPHAPAAFARCFAERFRVLSEQSPWQIPAGDLAMLSGMIESHAAVAARRVPARRRSIAAWERLRLRQMMRQRLSLRIGHIDLLALPRR